MHKETDVKKLAKDHWNYIENVLITHKVDLETLAAIGFHYRTAMIHGYKHGVEDTKLKNKE